MITSLLCSGILLAEISVEPFGFSVAIEENGETAVVLTLSNSWDQDVIFSIDRRLAEDEEERLLGPHRDDAGDILEQYDAPSATRNFAWDDDDGWM